MLTVMKSAGIDFNFSDQLVVPIRIYRKPVARVILAMLFRPCGIHILSPVFRGHLVCGLGSLINQCPFPGADMRFWSRSQRRLNVLNALG